MSELISGKEALIALANGEDVEFNTPHNNNWESILDMTSPLDIGHFLDESILNEDRFKFRIKPRTIMIGNLEVPACGSDYKFGEPMYVLNSLDPDEYSRVILDDQDDIPLYWWRTESEIKQVVAALRKSFKGE